MKALARRIFLGVAGIGLFSLLAFSNPVHAYGQGTYGSCRYGSRPSDCVTNTTTTTPSGLKVAINLVDGQAIPPEGYQVTITPLNGQGSSFASVDIYIDGKKVATVTPGSNGTTTWFWDVEKYPNSKITFVVFDASGNKTTMSFSVSILEKPTAGAPVAPVNPADPGESASPSTPTQQGDEQAPATGFLAFISQAVASLQVTLEEAIKALPPALVKAFPYLLFLLILLEILILVYVTRREINELKELRRLAERERQLALMKQKLTGLVSHYLRTPLTILTGGLEGMSEDVSTKSIAQRILPITTAIHDTIESIVSRTSAEAVGSTSVIAKARTISMAKLFAVWLPVVGIGLLAIVFIHLARNVDRYDVSVTDSLTLFVFYTVLVVGAYVVIRRWALHQSELAATKDVLAYEEQLHQAQDTVITEVANTLLQQEKQLEPYIGQIPTSSMYAKYFRDGFDRLSSTINRFAIAVALKGSSPGDTIERPMLSQLLNVAQKELTNKEAQKNVSVISPADAEVPVRSARLLTLALRSLLDNAISYSREGEKIEVGLATSEQHFELSVTDHGKGLTPDQIATIFEPFNRVEDIEDFDHEGLGFSLYLDKLIMTYLGGDISAKSPDEQTTTFSLMLPSLAK